MQKTVGANSNVFFPLYDAHGNMVATLSRAGTGWSLSDQRSYDAWGQVRAGVTNGDPSGRYCANLGHKQDDESGLVYMRARYYEPGSGRFISEDPAMYGANWFCYVGNNPIDLVDSSGRTPLSTLIWAAVGVLGVAAGIVLPGLASMWTSVCARVTLIAGGVFLASWFLIGHNDVSGDAGDRTSAFGTLAAVPPVLALCVYTALAEGAAGSFMGIAGQVVKTVAAYSLVIGLFMALDSLESAGEGYIKSLG